ncbi:hypothetical protein DX877_10785 [Xylella fastidiosa subsp. fastidiosa]|nr:hypothetical protein XFLM_10385 [Xylella fastidiosa subsp. fastidiosa GB514]RUA35256.1 hypothetical protein DX877_10785 [Xylella fastidiosa subsp. fastidiosa]TNV90605.1 hypothetical protein C5H25_11180 [Xylella fastidiosa]RUA35297.1 hypothetical protein DX878_10650 [Xylella fastidiosa subsp. fastidiosa]RWA30297.1 hypothetical protein XfCFBP8071_09810 [Xylella fastidiosa subsp. fastidiosa]
MGFLVFFPVHGVFITSIKLMQSYPAGRGAIEAAQPARRWSSASTGTSPLPNTTRGAIYRGLYSLSDHLKLKFESDISGFFCVVLVVIRNKKVLFQ